MMLRKSYYLMLAILVVFGMASCKNDTSVNPPPPSNNTVTIRDNFFDPPDITVAAGRTVVWRHQGTNQHTVTSGTPTSNPGSIFESGTLSSGGGFTFVFNQPGTYAYFCRIHGVNMAGTVTVK